MEKIIFEKIDNKWCLNEKSYNLLDEEDLKLFNYLANYLIKKNNK